MRVWMVASLATASFALLISACGELDIVDHDPLVLEPEGNTSEARARCGPLPPNVVPIAGLQTAWAMSKVPVDLGDASLRAATSAVVLRLSDEGVACGVSLDPEVLGCPSAWAVDVTLRNIALGPGTFDLVDSGQSGAQPGWDLATAHRVHTDCVREREQGTFETGAVEIYTVTDDCVVGRLVDTANAMPAADSPLEGGFVALRCDRE